MSMTMRVYDVDSKTGMVVRVRTSVTVRPPDGIRPAPPLSSAYPPCRCPVCRDCGNDRGR